MAYEATRTSDNPYVVVDNRVVGAVTAAVQANSLVESKDAGVPTGLDKDMGTAYATNESGVLIYGWRQNLPVTPNAVGTRQPISISEYGGLLVDNAIPEAIPVMARRTTAGTTQLVAANASFRIFVTHLLIVASTAVQVSLIEGASAVVLGPLDIGRGLEASGTLRNPVWRTSGANLAFQFSTSATANVTVKVNYIYKA